MSTELGSVQNTVEYRDVGVILTVTPRISPDGFVRMEVAPEISSLSASPVDFGTGVSAPVFNTRGATTTVSVQSGHTIIIGGLISTIDEEVVQKVPILGDIPLLGILFRDKSVRKTRTELLIILTPHVLNNISDTDRVTRENIQRSNIQNQPGRDENQERLLEELRSGARDIPIENPQAPQTQIPWTPQAPQTQIPWTPQAPQASQKGPGDFPERSAADTNPDANPGGDRE